MRVPPQIPQRFGACGVRRLVAVAYADVVDGLQLVEVPYNDHGDAPEMIRVRVKAPLSKPTPPGLLEAAVHAVEEGSPNEGYLIDNEEHHVSH